MDATARPELAKVYVAYRGLHDVKLAQFRHAVGPGYAGRMGAYVQANAPTWASLFMTRGPKPDNGRLHRGFMLKLEVPGDRLPSLSASRPEIAQRMSNEPFVTSLRQEDTPDLTPLIAEIGFAGADGVIKYYPYEKLFTPDRKLTPFAKELDARMMDAK